MIIRPRLAALIFISVAQFGNPLSLSESRAEAPVTEGANGLKAESAQGDSTLEMEAKLRSGLPDFGRFVKIELESLKDVAEAKRRATEFITGYFKNLSDAIVKEYQISPELAPFRGISKSFPRMIEKAETVRDVVNITTKRFEFANRQHRINLDSNRYALLAEISKLEFRLKAMENRPALEERISSVTEKSASRQGKSDLTAAIQDLINPQTSAGLATSLVACLSILNFFLLMIFKFRSK
jgi:hypothetical protein